VGCPGHARPWPADPIRIKGLPGPHDPRSELVGPPLSCLSILIVWD
jgi:hypothetical protein